MSKVRVINAVEANWYKVGEEYEVKDANEYKPIGIRVYRTDNKSLLPDLIAKGDYEYIDEESIKELGYWKDSRGSVTSAGKYRICSQCGQSVFILKNIPDYKFCPNCGLNMRSI